MSCYLTFLTKILEETIVSNDPLIHLNTESRFAILTGCTLLKEKGAWFNKENTILLTSYFASKILVNSQPPILTIIFEASHTAVNSYSYAALAYNHLQISSYNQKVRMINQLTQETKIGAKLEKIFYKCQEKTSSLKTQNTPSSHTIFDSEHLIIEKTIKETNANLFEQRTNSADAMIAYLRKYLEISTSRQKIVTIALGNIKTLGKIVMEYAQD